MPELEACEACSPGASAACLKPVHRAGWQTARQLCCFRRQASDPTAPTHLMPATTLYVSSGSDADGTTAGSGKRASRVRNDVMAAAVCATPLRAGIRRETSS